MSDEKKRTQEEIDAMADEAMAAQPGFRIPLAVVSIRKDELARLRRIEEAARALDVGHSMACSVIDNAACDCGMDALRDALGESSK